MQTALGPALLATKGWRAPEVAQAYTRARELCQQVGDTPQLFPVLLGLWTFSVVRPEFQTARELGEQLLRLAPARTRPDAPPRSPLGLGRTLFFMGGLRRRARTWSR